MRPVTENMEKLPKWAQVRIRVLEERVVSLQETLKEISAGETDTWIRDDLRTPGSRIHLPMGAVVCFGAQRERYIQVRVRRENEHDAGTLDVNGMRSLVVHPNAANSLTLELGR